MAQKNAHTGEWLGAELLSARTLSIAFRGESDAELQGNSTTTSQAIVRLDGQFPAKHHNMSNTHNAG
jgi:hypothetical protein